MEDSMRLVEDIKKVGEGVEECWVGNGHVSGHAKMDKYMQMATRMGVIGSTHVHVHATGLGHYSNLLSFLKSYVPGVSTLSPGGATASVVSIKTVRCPADHPSFPSTQDNRSSCCSRSIWLASSPLEHL
jgi:hypothetical protein